MTIFHCKHETLLRCAYMSERIKLLVYIHNSDTKAKQKTKDDNDQTKQRERKKKNTLTPLTALLHTFSFSNQQRTHCLGVKIKDRCTFT